MFVIPTHLRRGDRRAISCREQKNLIAITSSLLLIVQTTLKIVTIMSAHPLSNVSDNIVASVNDDDDLMPWEQDGFVPRTASGKQKSPNQIRGELQRYIDDSGQTKTAVMNQLGVSPPSFYKFMDPKSYKNQWSATQPEWHLLGGWSFFGAKET